MSTVNIFFWLLEEGETEEYENLYADRVEEVERYIEKTGGRIKTKWIRRLKIGQEDGFKFVVPFYYKVDFLRGGILRVYWTAEGIRFPREHKNKNVKGNWIFRDFYRLGGIQTFEMISPYLLGGVAW